MTSKSTIFPEQLFIRAENLLVAYRTQRLTLATAESCTGGLVAGLLTEVAGSSDVVQCGFVTYANAAKQAMLGVSSDILASHGAVSRACALAMAAGVLAHSSADVAVAITGVAGPGGGSLEKPVGLVHFAVQKRRCEPVHIEQRFGPLSRSAIRLLAVEQALELLETQL